jgi:hypothetical protein
MSTSILWLALVAVAPAEGPTWLTDYGQAQRQGRTDGKPLAVFLAPEKEGWQKLVTDGSIGPEAMKRLSDDFVCVHIDTSTESGKRWAREFNMPSGTGIVLSDRSGEFQAFRREGRLESGMLTSTLERFDGRTAVRSSNYPPSTDGGRTVLGSDVIYGATGSTGPVHGSGGCSGGSCDSCGSGDSCGSCGRGRGRGRRCR